MSYKVRLEVFEGPLDLLLFLIKKDDLDINDIPISHITQEYLAYLAILKEMNLDLAGEFLVLAATLMAIKARTLLPSHDELKLDEGPDPRAELVTKLLEYQKFKQAAGYLERRGEQFKDVYYRGAPHFDESEKTPSISLADLLASLREILDRAEDAKKEVHGEEFPIEEKIAKVLRLLESRPYFSWEELFVDERKRRGILSCFLALLELIKLQKIFIRQEHNFGKIIVYRKEVAADAPSGDAVAPGG